MPRSVKKEDKCCSPMWGDSDSGAKMMCWHHKCHKIGALVFAISIVWILNIMGVIPSSVPWWLQAIAVLGFVAMRR